MKDTGNHHMTIRAYISQLRAHFKAKQGIKPEENNQHVYESKLDQLQNLQKLIGIVFDEVKIKKGNVFYVTLSRINQQISELEQMDKQPAIATSMLVCISHNILQSVTRLLKCLRNMTKF